MGCGLSLPSGLCTLCSRGRLLGCMERVAVRGHCSSLKGNGHMRPEMITQMIRKQFFCVTDVCVCNWETNSQTIHVCNWPVHGKYVVEAPHYTKKSCQKAL